MTRLFAFLLAFVCHFAAADNYWQIHFEARDAMIGLHPNNVGTGKILLLGDSNTEGFWWNTLTGYTAINAGYGGARIHDLAIRAQTLANLTRPKHLHLMIGTNNLILPPNHTEMLTLSADIATILDAFQAVGSKIVVWPVPPFTAPFGGANELANRATVNAALRQAADSRGLFWDWWFADQITIGGAQANTVDVNDYAIPGALNSDGVHFSASTQLSRYYRLESWRAYIKGLTGIDGN